jgi:hypothetical protein
MMAVGASPPEQETIMIECACGRCQRPMTATITFRFNRAGDPISHELLPAGTNCPTCSLPLHARNLLYVPASVSSRPAEALAENSNHEECVARPTC